MEAGRTFISTIERFLLHFYVTVILKIQQIFFSFKIVLSAKYKFCVGKLEFKVRMTNHHKCLLCLFFRLVILFIKISSIYFQANYVFNDHLEFLYLFDGLFRCRRFFLLKHARTKNCCQCLYTHLVLGFILTNTTEKIKSTFQHSFQIIAFDSFYIFVDAAQPPDDDDYLLIQISFFEHIDTIFTFWLAVLTQAKSLMSQNDLIIFVHISNVS